MCIVKIWPLGCSQQCEKSGLAPCQSKCCKPRAKATNATWYGVSVAVGIEGNSVDPGAGEGSSLAALSSSILTVQLQTSAGVGGFCIAYLLPFQPAELVASLHSYHAGAFYVQFARLGRALCILRAVEYSSGHSQPHLSRASAGCSSACAGAVDCSCCSGKSFSKAGACCVAGYCTTGCVAGIHDAATLLAVTI